MNRYKNFNLIVLVVGAIVMIAPTACAPDPRKEAQAFQIREQAEQDALNQTQNRAHADQMHQIQVQREQAIAPEKIAAGKFSIKVVSVVGTISVSIAMLALAVSFSYGSVRYAMASARRADVRANLIQLDPVTRQFPLFIHHVHGSKWALHNANTGSVLMLDEKNVADRQLIAAAGATQIAGVIAQEAGRSADPAGVSIINPPIVDYSETNGSVTVGKSIRRNNE